MTKRECSWAGRVGAAALAAVALAGWCSSARAYVYWPSNDVGAQQQLESANLDGTSPHIVVGGVIATGGLASDGSHVYLVEGLDPTIGRVNPDGTGLNTAFVRLPAPTCEPGSPLGSTADAIAVDGSYIYWSDPSFGTIGRASIVDGSSPNGQFLRGAGGDCGTTGHGAGPGGLAAGGGHVYWTNRDLGTIGRANSDGSGTTQSFISGAYQPHGIAVVGSDVYWTNNDPASFGDGTIGHAALDSTGALIPSSVNQSYITGTAVDGSVAVTDGYLYFDTADGWIGRASLDGSAITPHLARYGGGGGNPVGGLAADAGQPSPTTTTVSCAPASLQIFDPHNALYLADGVRAHDTATCTLTVTDTSPSPHRVSGTVTAAVTPNEVNFVGVDGSTCRLSPTATVGWSRCSVTVRTDPFLSGYVRNGPIALAATYSGETVHDGSATSTRVPVMTVYGCDFKGEGYTKVCDANGFVLIGGPRGKGGHTTSGSVKVGTARVTITVPNDCVLPHARFTVRFSSRGHPPLQRVQLSLGKRRVRLKHAPYIARLTNPSRSNGSLLTVNARVFVGPRHGPQTGKAMQAVLWVC